MQPEVHAVQATNLILAAHSRSSHAYHYKAPLLSTGSRSSCRSRRFYNLQILLDRNINKCFDKDVTKLLVRYQNKHINKYKANLINKHETNASKITKTKYIKTCILQGFNRYLRCSPRTTPMPSSRCSNTASTPLPRRPHAAATVSNLLSLCLHAAHMQLPCSLHVAPTSPPGPTPPQRCSNAAFTPSPHRRNAAAMPPQRVLTQSSRCPSPAARSSHAALTPAERLLHAASTPLAHCHNATETQFSCRYTQPSEARAAAVTAPSPHMSSSSCCSQ